MKLSLKAGTTSKLLTVFIQDNSVTTGAGLTGLVYNSGSLTAYYYREGAASAVAITLADMTVGTWGSGGFKAVDATNLPGVYNLGIPDAALAAGAKSVIVMLKGATNMAPLVLEIELTAIDNQDAVRAGLTALPNAAAEAAGGLYTRGVGAGQINQDGNGRIDANCKTWIGGAIPAVAITGVPVVDAKYILGTILAEGGAGRLAAAFNKLFDIAVPVLTAASVNQTGDSYARLGAPAGASVSADVAAVKGDTAAVKVQTDKLTFSVANQIDANVLDWNGTAVATPNTAGVPLVDTRVNARFNTAAAGGNTSITLDASASATNDFYKGMNIYIVSGTGAGQSRLCTAYNGATQVATVTPAWATNPNNTSKFMIIPAGADVEAWLGAVAPANTGDAYARLGSPAGASVSADVAAVKADTAAIKTKTDNLPSDPADASDIAAATAAIQADTDDIQSRLPAALVGGRMDSSVGAMAANTVTASALATDAVNEIVDQVWEEAIADHSGTAGSTAEKLAAAGAAGDPWSTAIPGAYGAGTAGKIVGDNLNATVSSRLATSGYTAPLDAAGTRSAVGLASANLDTQLAEIEGETDDIAAIKTQTDKLAFTVANQIDANVIDWKGAAAPAMTGDAFARLGAPAGASIAADLAEIEAETDAIAGLSTLDAAGVRSAVGLASANLDTQLAEIEAETDDIAAVKLKTDNLPASPAAVGSAMTLTSGERDAIAAALLGLADGVGTGFTVKRSLRIIAAAVAGKNSGGTFRDLEDSQDQITGSATITGDRTAAAYGT